MKKFYHEILHPRLKCKIGAPIAGLIFSLIGLVPGKSFSQSIRVTSVATIPVCAGSIVTVTFNATNGPGGSTTWYSNASDYRIYLSDASGTIFTPQGSTFNNSSQTYDITNGGTTTGLFQSFTIPAGTPAGVGYEISIGSANPAFDGSTGAGASAAFTITPDNTITLTSAAGTDGQTPCINTAITNITYTTSGATGATFGGLPAGVTGNWAANVVTISGTPTVSGPFSYTVTLTGGCGNITAAGTITVAANNTVMLTSAVGTDAQTPCINTAITDITYSTTGATGATFSGLPTGVTANWAGNVVTISGTPTATGPFSYIVTLTGGCGNITATGTITVTANNTITLTSAAGTDGQTPCINTAITNITYTTSGATGAAFSGLPAGVTGNWAANVVTISGTPTASGPFSYTVTLTGGCGNITATGTITVTANNTITLTSAVGTDAQTPCINTAITSIIYTTSGATGATFGGLPAGVTGNWAANVVTISGTPTASGPFSYTVTLTGGCGNITATGAITVTPNNTITRTSALGTDVQTLCINTAITNITYTTTGATGAIFGNLPAGVTGSWAANVVTISGTPTASGTFNYTIATTGGCATPAVNAAGFITVTPNNTISRTSAAGTDAQTKCINTAITSITYSTTGATGATFGGLPTGVTGNWAANVVTISGTPTASGPFSYTVTLTGGCGNITATGTITVTANNTITLTSAAGTDGQTPCINTAITNIIYTTTGATGATFSSLPAGVTGNWAGNVVTISGTPTVLGTFNYTVTTAGGCTTPAVTATGSITVNPLPTITIGSTTAVCFSASAQTTPLSYGATTNSPTTYSITWNPAPANSFVAVTDAALPVTPITINVPAGTAAGTYTGTITVKNANGCVSSTGTNFTVTVNPLPTVNPVSDQTVCNNSSTASITFSGSAVPLTTYNWTNSNTAIGPLAASGSGNISPFTATNAGPTPISSTITVTPVANGCSGSSQSFTITVNPTPGINTPPDLAYCNNNAGAAIVFSTPTPGVPSFDWTNSPAYDVGFGISGTGNIPAFTAVNINTPPNTPNSPVTTLVSVKATIAGCQSAAASFNVRVNPTPGVNPLTNLTYCNNDAAPAILFTSLTTGGTVTYDWTSSSNVGFGVSGTGNTILAFTATNGSNAPVTTTVNVKATVNGCQGPAMTFTITVNPTPVVNPVSSVTICAGAPGAAITFSSPTSPAPAISWTSTLDVGFGTSGNGNIPAFTAVNATSSAVTATVTVTAGVNGCSATTTFTVKINPTPAINALTDAACSYSSFLTMPVDVTNGIIPSGTVYTWTSPVLQPFVTVIGASTGTNQPSISGVLRNTDSSFTTGAPHTATYTVTPTAGTCIGATFQLVVTVNPVPPKVDASFFQDYTSNTQQICDGKQVGGGGQNDIDVLWLPNPPGGRPAAPFYENNGFDWDWEYSTSNTLAGPYESSPGTVSTFYQHVMPPSPSVFSSLGDHYLRFRLTRYGCTNYSDTVDLKIVSTLVPEAGGPYIECSPSTPVSLTGASITGTTTSGVIQGTWTVVPVGTNGATLGGTVSPSGTQTLPANGVMPTATFTPTPGFTGIAKLVLTSNDPDGPGALTCNPVFDTAYVVVLPSGNLLGCLAPATQWLLTKNGGSGSLDASPAPCASVLVGSDNGNTPSAAPINTDLTICSGTGNFIFNWAFTSPAYIAPAPVCNSADVRSASGNNGASFTVNRPLNLATGNLVIVTLHFRRNPGTITPPTIAGLAGFTLIRTTTTLAVAGSSSDSATVAAFYRVVPNIASEPLTYTFTIPSATNSANWRIMAARVTGQDPVTPIEPSTSGTTSKTNSITVPGVNTTVKNSLLVFAQSVVASVTAPNTNQLGMVTVYNSNTQTSARVATQTIAGTGATGTRTISWRTASSSAAEMFVIRPAVTVTDIDSAFAIVNGTETFLSATNGDLGTDSIPVTAGSSVGFRVRTTTNTGGAGKLTFYQVNVPNDTPKLAGIDTIRILPPACNPNDATINAAFIAPAASNICGAPMTIKAGYPTDVNASVNCQYTRTRTWIYQKSCGLESLPFSQTVVWTQDLIPPIVTPPPAQAFCFDPGNNYSIPVATVTDNNCSGFKTISYSVTGATSKGPTPGANASGLFNVGVSTITWTATDSCGNVDATKTTAVTVYPAATATLSGSATICNGGSTDLTVNFTGTGPWTFKYTDGTTTTTVTTSSNPYTFTVNPTVNTSYSLTELTSAGSCAGSFSGTAFITVRTLPTATISVSGPSAICTGGTATLSIAPTGTPPWTVEYSDGTSTFTTGSFSTTPKLVSVSPTLASTTYTITKVTDNFGCINNGPFGSGVTITVNPDPTITVTPSSATICTGSSVSLTAGGASTYSWSPASGLSATTGTTVIASPAATSTYTVTGTTAAGCVNSTSVTVTVSAPPVTAGVTICQGGAGTISSSTVCAAGTFASGPKNAGAAVDTAGPAGPAWVNPGNIVVPGTPYATASLSLTTSHYLKASHYGFAIPATANITAITVTINESCVGANTGVTDNRVQLVMAGTIVGNNLATGVVWPASGAFATQIYGGAVTLWVPTLTPTDVNDPNFGVALSAKSTNSGRNLQVDYMQITITYTVPGSLDWYTALSGGSLLGSGSPFNPVGVAGSGLPDTNTPGTHTYYAECATVPGCRSGADFVINPLPTITPAAAANVCLSSSAQTTTLSYTTTNTPTTYSITWNALASGVGFTPVTNAPLTNPINITVPGTATANTYTGTITVTNANSCVSSPAVSFTVTVNPPSVGGTLPSVSVCTVGTGTLMLTGYTGSILQWESSTNGGSSWTIITNTTDVQNYSASAVTTLYRVLVQSGACSSIYSNIATIGIHNVWTGVNSIDWNDGTNWSDGVVPTASCPDVFIPGATPFEPTVSGGTPPAIINLHILNGAAAAVTISNTGTLQIKGGIFNQGVFDVTQGTLELNGTSGAQTIDGNSFHNNIPGSNNRVNNLILSNDVIVANTPNDTLNISGTLSFSTGAVTLNTGGNITLKSSVSSTANLGMLAVGNVITGDVTVERYIATGNTGYPNHGKSWQMLATPTIGQNINQSWMEGATASNLVLSAASNPYPGYGTMVTSDVAGAGTFPKPGFDVYTSPGPSIKAYDYLTTGFIGPDSMQAAVYNKKGWYVFVRGDRGVNTSAGAATPTVLRTKGQLFTAAPGHLPPSTNVVAGNFESIGNPYASAVDMKIIRSRETPAGNIDEFFYVWDPRIGGSYGYGAYQTFSLNSSGDYFGSLPSATYGPFGTVNNYIQSGQAFLVHATSGGAVNFDESVKVNGSALVTSPNPVSQTQSIFRISLNAFNSDGSTSVLDGVLVDYGDAYNNAVDNADARKLLNAGENLGIKVGGALLAIERAQSPTALDTIFLNVTGERVQPYQLKFDATNMGTDVQAFLVDNYLGTRLPLSLTGSANVNFTVQNIAGSNAANRFMIVFEPLKALPVTIANLKAYLQDSHVNVEWKVDNEQNMKQYEVEKSIDGISFNLIDMKKAIDDNGGSASYTTVDTKPADGYNYYRVRMVDINGQVGYTGVVKVLMPVPRPDILISPNPITDGMIHLQLVNQPVGRYGIRLLNKLGQLIVQKQINHAAGSSTELIKWDYNLAHGMYQLEVTKPDGSIKDLNVMY